MGKVSDNVHYHPYFSIECSEQLKIEPVSTMLYHLMPVDGSDQKCIRHISDVKLLFHQQKLTKAQIVALQNHFAPPTKSPYRDGAYTDEQLMSLIKPRNIQSHAELKAWSEFLTDKAKEIQTEYETYIENTRAEEIARAAAEQVASSSATSTTE